MEVGLISQPPSPSRIQIRKGLQSELRRRRYPFPGDATFARDPPLYLAPRSFFARPNIGLEDLDSKVRIFLRVQIWLLQDWAKSEAQVATIFQASCGRSRY